MVLGSDIRSEVQSLRLLITDLEARLSRLESRIAEEEQDTPLSPFVPVTGPKVSQSSAASSCNSSTLGYSLVSCHGPGVILDQDLREEAARETGRFFERSLRGVYRGSSGRERVNLANYYYVLVRDRHNVVHDPVSVFQRFSDLRPHVALHRGFGDSIFAGFHSAWEAELATRTAGLTYPAPSH